MYKGQSITVIIPCLNEEEGIERVLRAMPEFVDEIIVVDNGSTDRTADVAQSLGAKVIREEVRGGRSPINAIDAGFSRALATILDSNITTFIAAAVLFYIGTGPVRGFAVTLGIGIITTVFTAFELTRLIVAGWVRGKRPQSVPI